jgi:hypothetical protein
MNTKTKTLIGIMMVAVLLCGSGTGWSQSLPIESPGTITPLLQYQGRLTDPATGAILPNGSYTMSFQLYAAESGGTALWSETKSVPVQGGLFSTILGNTTAINPALFNGQALWLEVWVQGEQLSPRQPVLPVAYAVTALTLAPGATVDSLNVNGNLSVAGNLVGGSHTHAGEAITSGTVADARIASSIARDSEILPTLLEHDGAGSNIDADLLDGNHANAFALSSHVHAGEAITSGIVADARIDPALARDNEILPIVLAGDGNGSGLDADLLDGLHANYFAPSSHAHSGEQITSGTIADARIAANLARDNEILPIVLAGDGSGSGLDADLLDGYHANAFALSSHVHAGEAITSGIVADARIAATLARDNEILPIVLAGDGSGSGLDADLLDGYHANAFSLASHLHDDRYVKKTGDTMSGTLTVPQINYTTDHISYYMVGGEGFLPASNVPYSNSYGNGGAYLISGFGAIAASVNLPQNAKVLEFTVYFYDNSKYDVTVDLEFLSSSGGYYIMAEVASTGIPGYYSATVKNISYPTIDNNTRPYSIRAWSDNWDSSYLRIMAAKITYSMNSVP